MSGVARPVSFDREEVLAQATAVFWAHGYGDTSISRLVEATHLQPGSLYARSSQGGLFLATLDHYAGQTLAHLHATLAAAPDPLQGVRRFVGRTCRADGDARDPRLFSGQYRGARVGRHNAVVRSRLRQHRCHRT